MRRLILSLVLASSVNFLSAQDEWAGVWRVVTRSEGQEATVFTFHVQPQDTSLQLTIYPEAARPMTIQELEFRAEEDVLQVKASASETQPLPMLFNLTREGNRVSGTWLFAHMQFGTTVSGPLEGLKVFEAPYWEPWLDTEVRRPERFIDLATLLATEAPRGQFADFQVFWDEQIERNYYFYLHRWVYGREGDPLAHKKQRLESLFQVLQDEVARRRLQEIGPIAERVVRAAKLTHRNEEELRFFLVSLPGAPDDYEEFLWSRVPTEEEEASCRCKLDLRERFIFLNPLQFAAEGSGPVLSEKQALIRSLWADSQADLVTGIFREALALEMALEMQGVEWPLSAPGLAAARIEFAPLFDEKKSQQGAGDAAMESALVSTLSYTLGLGVVRELRKKHNLTQLFRLQPREILETFKAFLSEGG